MPVDSNIALSFRAPQIESPVNMMAQMQQLQGGRQANELRAMQMDEMRADREQQNALAQFMRGYQPGVTDDRQALAYGRGGREAFTALSTAARERATADRQTEELRLKRIEAQQGALGRALLLARDNPSDEGLLSAGRLVSAQGLDVSAQIEQLMGMPPEQRRLAINNIVNTDPQSRSAVEFVSPKWEERNAGNRKFYVDNNPRSPTFNQTRGDMPMKPTPDAVMTDARVRSEGALNRANATANAIARAPTITEVIDPSNPQQMLRIDARTYRGGSAGAPGVIGVSGKEPAAAAKEKGVMEGRASLADQTAGLLSLYTTLNDKGGMTNTTRGAFANAGTRAMASAPGMLVGSFNPGEVQVLRENIKNARPMLLQAIKQATGLTSGQLNSNVELTLWLNSVTDPTQPFETAQYTLQNLDKILVTDRAARAAAWKQIKQGPQGPSAGGAITPPAAPTAPALPALPSGFRVD